MYASAQTLDIDSASGLTLRAACAVNFCGQKFLAMPKNSSFPNWKPIVSHPEFPDGHYLPLDYDDGILSTISIFFKESTITAPVASGAH